MTSFSVLDAIDAIVSDLQAQSPDLGLPSFMVEQYAQPLWTGPDKLLKPLLAVYVSTVTPELLTTSGEYAFVDKITVGWFEPVPDSMETLIVDNTQARGIIKRAEVLHRYMGEAYFAGIPGLSAQAEVTLEKIRYGRPQGGTFGCECDLIIRDFR